MKKPVPEFLTNEFQNNPRQSSHFIHSHSTEDGTPNVPVWLSGMCVELASMMKDFLHGGIHLGES
jgi:hypothetical protein